MNKTIIIISTLLLWCVTALPGQTVTAPEAPFDFEPLEMYSFPDKSFPITRYGARQDNVKANTIAFGKAMAACNRAGGGYVVVPAGKWVTGPIHFQSNCNLYLSEGATIVFEDDPSLYLPAVKTSWEGAECMGISPLIYAYGCHNIAISGKGALAPKMDFWRTWFERPQSHTEATRQLYAMLSTGVPIEYRHMEADSVQMRPPLIHFNRCTNIQLDGFHIKESPFWTIHLFMCKDVWAHNLDVYAHGHNNDGIDLEMTQHALVEDCTFDQGDDGVVIKAGRNQDGWRLAMPSSDIVIRNCNIINGHSVLGIGSEMSAGVRRVYMHDCSSTNEVYRLFYIKTNHRRGGFIEDITVENVSAAKMLRVFEIDTDVLYQWRDIVPTFETRITSIRNITMRGARAGQADAIYEISGDSRLPIEGVLLEDIKVDQINRFTSKVSSVNDLIIKDVTYGKFIPLDRDVEVPGIAPGK